MVETIAGLILAGGASRRMGGSDKFLLQIGGQPLIDRAIDRLRPQVGPVAISANCDPSRLGDTRLPMVPDAEPAGRGPLAGILAGLEWARAETTVSHLVTAASDAPFFPADLVARLVASARTSGQIVLAASRGRRHPVFGLWPLGEYEPLGDWLRSGTSLKVTDYVGSRNNTACDFQDETGIDPFFNVNTPEHLDEARRLAEAWQ